MLEQFFALNLFTFLLVFCRLGAAISLMPGFSQQHVNMRARLMFALAISLLLTPLLIGTVPTQPVAASALVLLIGMEIITGVFLGLIPRILMSTLQTAGTVLAMVSSMANQFVLDPISEQQSSLLASFLGVIGITLIFVTDTHYLMLWAIVDSYALFPPGQPLIIGDMADLMARKLAESFRLGVQLASPMILSGLAYYSVLGILGRLMPQLPVFFFGLPIQILMQMLLFIITLSTMMMVFMGYFESNLLALMGR